MKRILFLTNLLLVLSVLPYFASADDSHNLSADEVLIEIMSSQNVDEKTLIDCQKVTDGQFEEMGEAAMSLIHPNEEQHKLMDQMMGGEGSASLEDAHITMGKNYLGCGSGVMGGGMMGNWSNSMMGGFGLFGQMGWLLVLSVWVLIAVAIAALIRGKK